MMNSHENRPLVKDINCTADLKRDSAFTTQPTTLGNALQFTPPNNTVQLTTTDNALQFPVSNATDNTLQSSVITFDANTTVQLAEQDVRPILGDNNEGSEG
ncbi:hypothetical protein [Candidatus Tisiphia endosymbiont of Myopa tessellatipennis]|uniref:hypothetical protein n=1 Tax=Candidatus Tisiphia endosymbiont of Myopa tessellatipennis TaxID=3066257 RepID=UPI00313C216F